MPLNALKRRAREAETWLHEACFPLWSEAGVSPSGPFRETLTLDHRAQDTDLTRVRVQARQTYVFTESLRQGWQPVQARRLVERGVGILTTQALRPDGLAGRSLHADGSGLSDDTVDLNDCAFVLFALARAYDVLGPTGPGAEMAAAGAQRVFGAIDTLLKDAAAGGFAETLPAPAIRLQNPHMHLLEAALALHAAHLPDCDARALAASILLLFDTHFTAGPGGLLGEAFTADWHGPAPGSADNVEPGHQFEWVWLLLHAESLGLSVQRAAPETLHRFALSTLDADGRAILSISRAGVPHDATARTWSQTEALKAHLARLEATGEGRFAEYAVSAFDVLMDQFLTPDGGWRDHLAADGTCLAKDMPASTGYHVVLAFSELMRVAR